MEYINVFKNRRTTVVYFAMSLSISKLSKMAVANPVIAYSTEQTSNIIYFLPNCMGKGYIRMTIG